MLSDEGSTCAEPAGADSPCADTQAFDTSCPLCREKVVKHHEDHPADVDPESVEPIVRHPESALLEFWGGAALGSFFDRRRARSAAVSLTSARAAHADVPVDQTSVPVSLLGDQTVVPVNLVAPGHESV